MILLLFLLKMAIKIFFGHKSFDLRIDWDRVLLLRQIKSILRAKNHSVFILKLLNHFFRSYHRNRIYIKRVKGD